MWKSVFIMYTVGLVSKSCLKTFSYSSFEEANKEFKSWMKIFKLNNVVEHSTTIIEKDTTDSITSVKIIFHVAHDLEYYIMFLAKNKN